MTYYCQSCGGELAVTEDSFLEGVIELVCPVCGDKYRRPDGYSEDQMAAWLGFPPSQTAA